VRLIDTGSIDADNASVYGLEFGGNWKSLYLQGEHFWLRRRTRGSRACRTRFHGLLPAGQLGAHRREPALQRGHRLVPESPALVPFSGNGGLGAWELARATAA
jgi:hypothetical protein